MPKQNFKFGKISNPFSFQLIYFESMVQQKSDNPPLFGNPIFISINSKRRKESKYHPLVSVTNNLEALGTQ